MDVDYPAVSLAAVLGYLLGSISFGLLLTRLAGLGDIRQVGSGNIGATNVLRTGNKVLAALTLILDSGKGAAAATIASFFWGGNMVLIAGFAAVLGHNFPVWLQFRGGKGVATSLGVLLVTSWMVGVAACATWLLVAGVFRYSSLAALVTLSAATAYAFWLVGLPLTIMAGSLAVLSIVRHHQNIARMIRGEEAKIGAKNVLEQKTR